MTPDQHNKYLGYAHLAYAIIYSVFLVLLLVIFGGFFVAILNSPDANNPPPPAVFFVIWVVIAVMYSAFTIPSFIASYALLKRKRWAKVASIIGGVIAAMSFPIGTAVCVYTFWFLFSEPGKLLYDTPAQQLSPPGSAMRPLEHEFQSTPRSAPPDWR